MPDDDPYTCRVCGEPDDACLRICSRCGGTGDAFDFDAEDWANPTQPCGACNGTGCH